jgi:hypothetical protein
MKNRIIQYSNVLILVIASSAVDLAAAATIQKLAPSAMRFATRNPAFALLKHAQYSVKPFRNSSQLSCAIQPFKAVPQRLSPLVQPPMRTRSLRSMQQKFDPTKPLFFQPVIQLSAPKPVVHDSHTAVQSVEENSTKEVPQAVASIPTALSNPIASTDSPVPVDIVGKQLALVKTETDAIQSQLNHDIAALEGGTEQSDLSFQQDSSNALIAVKNSLQLTDSVVQVSKHIIQPIQHNNALVAARSSYSNAAALKGLKLVVDAFNKQLMRTSVQQSFGTTQIMQVREKSMTVVTAQFRLLRKTLDSVSQAVAHTQKNIAVQARNLPALSPHGKDVVIRSAVDLSPVKQRIVSAVNNIDALVAQFLQMNHYTHVVVPSGTDVLEVQPLEQADAVPVALQHEVLAAANFLKTSYDTLFAIITASEKNPHVSFEALSHAFNPALTYTAPVVARQPQALPYEPLRVVAQLIPQLTQLPLSIVPVREKRIVKIQELLRTQVDQMTQLCADVVAIVDQGVFVPEPQMPDNNHAYVVEQIENPYGENPDGIENQVINGTFDVGRLGTGKTSQTVATIVPSATPEPAAAVAVVHGVLKAAQTNVLVRKKIPALVDTFIMKTQAAPQAMQSHVQQPTMPRATEKPPVVPMRIQTGTAVVQQPLSVNRVPRVPETLVRSAAAPVQRATVVQATTQACADTVIPETTPQIKTPVKTETPVTTDKASVQKRPLTRVFNERLLPFAPQDDEALTDSLPESPAVAAKNEQKLPVEQPVVQDNNSLVSPAALQSEPVASYTPKQSAPSRAPVKKFKSKRGGHTPTLSNDPVMPYNAPRARHLSYAVASQNYSEAPLVVSSGSYQAKHADQTTGTGIATDTVPGSTQFILTQRQSTGTVVAAPVPGTSQRVIVAKNSVETVAPQTQKSVSTTQRTQGIPMAAGSSSLIGMVGLLRRKIRSALTWLWAQVSTVFKK